MIMNERSVADQSKIMSDNIHVLSILTQTIHLETVKQAETYGENSHSRYYHRPVKIASIAILTVR